MISLALALISVATHAPTECQLPSGWSEIAAKEPRFIVFGETHGTRESPEFVASLACALANKGERILVAVEISATSDAALQQLWKSPAEGFGERLVAQLPGFANRQDGVASQAMLGMLSDLHGMALRGKKVDVVAFNGIRDQTQAVRWQDLKGQGPHEAAQAENIADAAASKSYDRIIVLVGNLHARRVPRDRGIQFEPMAMRLGRVGALISLIQSYPVGTAWNCTLKEGETLTPGVSKSPAKLDCGPHKSQQTKQGAITRRLQMGIWPQGDAQTDSAFDGYYWFEKVHASPPARSGSAE